MTTATSSVRRPIGSFNGDFDELAALMERSWSENKEQSLRYSSRFLRSAFDYPGSSLELAPAIYRDGRLAAFVAGFPRTIRIAGQLRRMLSISYLTVAPEHKRSGYGPLVWGELLERARNLGYDGALDFTVEGDPWSGQILPVARVLRQPTAHVFTVPFMARLLKPDGGAPAAQQSNCAMHPVLRQAASHIPAEVTVARCWSEAEAEWQCCRRAGAMNTTMSVEGRQGILNGYVVETSGAAPMPTVMLDNILWGKLAPGECVQLAKAFVDNAAKVGVRMIVTPVLGYADMQPLAAAGFRKTRRLLHAYLTAWTFAPPTPITSMYLDVF
jgi:GNAT superfamily N-acetyltransferase